MITLMATGCLTQSDQKAMIAKCYKSLKGSLVHFQQKDKSSLQIGGMQLYRSREYLIELNKNFKLNSCENVSRPKLIEFLMKYLVNQNIVDCIKPIYDYFMMIDEYPDTEKKTDPRIVTKTIELLSFMDEIEAHCNNIH